MQGVREWNCSGLVIIYPTKKADRTKNVLSALYLIERLNTSLCEA